MAKKKVIVSRSGLTTCPSCMSHITLDASLAHTECPFCHTNLVAERSQDEGVFGRNTLQTLKKSKSAMLAAALGASLSMAACGEGDNNDNNTTKNNSTVQPAYGAPLVDMEAEDMPEDMAQPQPLYGGAATDMGDGKADAGMTQPAYGAPLVDMDVEMSDMDFPAPEYGAPPTDM